MDHSFDVVWKPGLTLKRLKQLVILAALKHFGGNRKHTAIALGMSPRGLRQTLHNFRKQGIKVPPHHTSPPF